MKHFTLLFFTLFALTFKGFSQTENINLKENNLDKGVRKTIEHFYQYDQKKHGYIKSEEETYIYNNKGNLIETNTINYSAFKKSTPNKYKYNYNAQDQLINTIDISDVIDENSKTLRFTYNSKGLIEKKEFIYPNNENYYETFIYDKDGKEIKDSFYEQNGKLIHETNTSYEGVTKTSIKSVFNGGDGSLRATYTTIYKNGLKTEYKNTEFTTIYKYDDYKNIIKTEVSENSTLKTHYLYKYDKKNIWTKKHTISGIERYFSFREIHYDSGEITGSTEPDNSFNTKFNYYRFIKPNAPKMLEIKSTSWNFSLIDYNGEKINASGKIAFFLPNFSPKLETGSSPTISIVFNDDPQKTELEPLVYDDYFDQKTNSYVWLMNVLDPNNTNTLTIFKESILIDGKKTIGTFKTVKDGDTLTIYLL